MSDPLEKYFDVHHLGLGESPADMLAGAVVYDPPNTLPPGYFRVRPLSVRVGPEDARYPSDADVIDLQIPTTDLSTLLHEPAERWFALCRSRKKRKNVIHLNLPRSASIVKGVMRLAKSFGQTQFIIDPFAHGAHDGWQAQVCLGEEENVWLSSRGLQTWPNDAANDAIYFLIGEVGAGKLLFGSGCGDFSPLNWLCQFSFLDSAQRQLILHENAKQLFSA